MTFRLILALSASTLLDFLVGLALVLLVTRRHPERRLTGKGVLVAALGTAVVWVPKAIALRVIGLYGFGQIHLVYLDLFVLLPALGALALCLPRLWPAALPSISPGARAIALGCVTLAAVGLYATWIEPTRLEVVRCRVPARTAPTTGAAARPIRVAVLADVQTPHIGEFEWSVVRETLLLEPDIILLPGDLYCGLEEFFDRELAGFREFLRALRAPHGTYLVEGDSETGGPWRGPQIDIERRAQRLVQGTGVQLLRHESITLEVQGRRVTIGGSRCHWRDATSRAWAESFESMSGDDLRLLLTHRPGTVYNLQPHSRVDLVVAGHTHGGQVQLPFFGPPITLSSVPRHVAAGGLHELDGRRVYVSRGIGLERMQAPRLRFLCRPELTLLELE